jgi:hypothetical protein
MHSSPAQYGTFCAGTELVLWRPGLDHRQLRRRAVRRCLMPDAALYAIAGLLAILLGLIDDPPLLLAVAAGAVLILVATLMAHHDFLRFGHDLSENSAAWRTDRGQGEWFFRPGDFTDRSLASAHTAARIIDAVHLIHTGPAASWLDPDQLGRTHRLAWETLAQLYMVPSALGDLQVMLDRLDLVAARAREVNRRFYDTRAITGTEDVLACLAGIRDVLTAGATS